MGCVSADDTNFLPAGKKVVRHDMSGVAACSQYDVHKVISLPALDARAHVLDSNWACCPDAFVRVRAAQLKPEKNLDFDFHGFTSPKSKSPP
jgi:hypothetical protein